MILRRVVLFQYFILFFLLPISFLGFGQNYMFENFNKNDGLPGSQIKDITQDQDGYIWIATFSGLSRFDGIEFKNYHIDDGLLDDKIYNLFVDKKNRLWIGTKTGITLYDGKEFKSFFFKPQNRFIRDIAEFDGKMYFTTYVGQDIIMLDHGEISYLNNPNIIKYLNSFQNKFIGLAENGIYQLTDSTQTSLVQQDLQPIGFEKGKKGNLFTYSVNDKSIYSLKINSKNKFDLLKEETLPSSTSDIKAFQIDQQGCFWFASTKNLLFFDQKKSNFIRFNQYNGLDENYCLSVLVDRENIIWVGTNSGGIFKLKGLSVTHEIELDKVKNTSIMAFTETKDSTIICGTYNEGLFSIKDSVQVRFPVIRSNGNSIRSITSLLEHNDSLWIGTRKGIYVYDYKSYQHYPSKRVGTLFKDSKDRIWIGTSQKIILYENGNFQHIEIDSTIENFRVVNIFEDKNSKIWIATSHGFYIYHDNLQIQRFNLPGLNKGELEVLTYQTAVLDKDDGIWIGSNRGLHLFYKNQFHSLIIPGIHGNKTIYQLLTDDDYLWVGTVESIYRIHIPSVKIDKYISNFTKIDNNQGLAGNELNLRAIIKTKKNQILVGANEALNKINPDYLNRINTKISPKIIIQAVFVNQQNILISPNSKVNLNKDGYHQIQSGIEQIHFEFRGINHNSPDEIQYQYKLEGNNSKWSLLSSQNQVTYSAGLPPGKYIFKVKAINEKGFESAQPDEFKFILLPAFYQTWWFKLIYIGLTVVCIYLLVRWRGRALQSRQKNQIKEYQTKLFKLEHQSLNASMNRHFIFNSLNSIQYYINKNDRIAANKYLTRFAKLIRKNLDSSTNESNFVSLSDEIERLELYLDLEMMRFREKFTYQIKIDPKLDTENIEILPMLVQPFIENSLWHGILPSKRKGNIILKIDSLGINEIYIEVFDNGIGIETSKIEKAKSLNQHQSKGVKITSARLDLLKKITKKNVQIHGPKEIKDDNGNTLGTMVSIIIPKHYSTGLKQIT